MARKAPKYAHLPDRIMGLRCSKHRVHQMKYVLRHLGQDFPSNATKLQLLEGMVNLENKYDSKYLAFLLTWIRLDRPKTPLTAAKRDAEKRGVGAKELNENFSRQQLLSGGKLPYKAVVKAENTQDHKVKMEEEDSEEEIITVPVKKECSVCMDALPPNQFPEENLTNSCDHEISICHSCITQSIDQQIDDQPYENISCPECPCRLSYETIKQAASKESFGIYTGKGFKEAIEKMEGYTKCLSPTCLSGQLHGSGHAQPIMTCIACGFKMCWTHLMPWHTDQTCAQYDEENRTRLEQEEATERLLAETSKACPNHRCGYLITKIGGCDHMTCRMCGYEFCWLCMASYSRIRGEGNSAHAEICRYHSRRLPQYDPVPPMQPAHLNVGRFARNTYREVIVNDLEDSSD